MKSQRYFTMVFCLLITLSLLTSCLGYNTQMQNYLKDETNYHPYHGTVCDIYYFDAENEKVSLLSTNKIPECNVVIELTFDDFNTVGTFLGAEPNPDWSLEKYRFAFDITKENHIILAQNGFYNTVTINTPIEITASSYIYMDSNFFWISSVTYNDTEYLRFNEGIKNIKDHIDKHKSLI